MLERDTEFKVGEVAVYPGHGVGRIESIEEREFCGQRQAFYILRILDTDMTIMVPVNGARTAGLRCIIDQKDVERIYEILKEEPVIHDNIPWNRRYKEYMEKIKSGSLYDVAFVLRELYCLRSLKELSFGEKKMFEMAKNLLKKELAFALNLEEEKVERKIEELFSRNKKA
jgi:CarD family transcriptional regulator